MTTEGPGVRFGVVNDTAPEARGSRRAIDLARTTFAAAALACGVWLFSGNLSGASGFALEPWQGGPKPPLSLDVLDGERISLDDYEGRAVIVHFFATWCEPCVEELGSLERLASRQDDTSLAILAVDVGEIDARVRTFFRKHPVSFPILLDRDRAATKEWQVHALPSSFVMKRGLVPILFVEGDIDWDSPDVVALLDAAIQSPAEGLSAYDEAEGE